MGSCLSSRIANIQKVHNGELHVYAISRYETAKYNRELKTSVKYTYNTIPKRIPSENQMARVLLQSQEKSSETQEQS